MMIKSPRSVMTGIYTMLGIDEKFLQNSGWKMPIKGNIGMGNKSVVVCKFILIYFNAYGRIL
jgi:hypothetical protein